LSTHMTFLRSWAINWLPPYPLAYVCAS
jgi:hypothetical protein